MGGVSIDVIHLCYPASQPGRGKVNHFPNSRPKFVIFLNADYGMGNIPLPGGVIFMIRQNFIGLKHVVYIAISL